MKNIQQMNGTMVSRVEVNFTSLTGTHTMTYTLFLIKRNFPKLKKDMK